MQLLTRSRQEPGGLGRGRRANAEQKKQHGHQPQPMRQPMLRATRTSDRRPGNHTSCSGARATNNHPPTQRHSLSMPIPREPPASPLLLIRAASTTSFNCAPVGGQLVTKSKTVHRPVCRGSSLASSSFPLPMPAPLATAHPTLPNDAHPASGSDGPAAMHLPGRTRFSAYFFWSSCRSSLRSSRSRACERSRAEAQQGRRVNR